MKNKFLSLSLVAAAVMSMSTFAHAAGTPLNLTVSGSITASTCTVASSDGTLINLAPSEKADVTATGDDATAKTISITLSGCTDLPAGTPAAGIAALQLVPGTGGRAVGANNELFGGKKTDGMGVDSATDLGIAVYNTTPGITAATAPFVKTGDQVKPGEYAVIKQPAAVPAGTDQDTYTGQLTFKLAETSTGAAKAGEGISAPITVSYYYQ